MNIVQIYTVVEAKNVNELVKLVNIKTKAGWICLGGMAYVPNNFCDADSQNYPFCQTMYRMEKPRSATPEKNFEAFPYEHKATPAAGATGSTGPTAQVNQAKIKHKPKPKMHARYKKYNKKKNEKK